MVHIDVYCDNKGEWRWRLLAANHKQVACSGEGYKSRSYTVKRACSMVAFLKDPCEVRVYNRNGKLSRTMTP